MKFVCLRMGHWYAIKDLMGLKHCLACNKVSELYEHEAWRLYD